MKFVRFIQSLRLPCIYYEKIYFSIDTARFPKKAINTYTQYEIAFANFGWLNTDVFVADGDGSNPHPLSASSGLDYNASFFCRWQMGDLHFQPQRLRRYLARTFRRKRFEQLTNDLAFDDQAVFSP